MAITRSAIAAVVFSTFATNRTNGSMRNIGFAAVASNTTMRRSYASGSSIDIWGAAGLSSPPYLPAGRPGSKPSDSPPGTNGPGALAWAVFC